MEQRLIQKAFEEYLEIDGYRLQEPRWNPPYFAIGRFICRLSKKPHAEMAHLQGDLVLWGWSGPL